MAFHIIIYLHYLYDPPIFHSLAQFTIVVKYELKCIPASV